MNKLFDLRFVIGFFFLIIGLLLILNGILTGISINLICGFLFVTFAAVMLLFFRKSSSDSE